MWMYKKMLEFPVNIKNKDLRMAKYLVTQYGGPNGELGAAIRYLNQRYTMPDGKGKALLTDIGTEELGHVEMISTMIYQLTKDASIAELEAVGLGGHYAQFGKALFPTDTEGVPFTVAYIAATGDFMADLAEDIAAEEKARATYENLMNMTNDPDVLAPLSFLHQREIIHKIRFEELLNEYKQKYPNE
jgi:spore coat protein JC